MVLDTASRIPGTGVEGGEDGVTNGWCHQVVGLFSSAKVATSTPHRSSRETRYPFSKVELKG